MEVAEGRGATNEEMMAIRRGSKLIMADIRLSWLESKLTEAWTTKMVIMLIPLCGILRSVQRGDPQTDDKDTYSIW